MKKTQIIYRVSTGIIAFMMLFSAYKYFTDPQIGAGFRHLGFPDYFRMELAIAKLLGALVLAIPQIPVKVKEWAYAGFGITFISAFIAHVNSGDAIGMAVAPLIFLLILIVSNSSFSKLKNTGT